MTSSSRAVGRPAQEAVTQPALVLLVLVATLLALAGCSAGEPRTIGPAGVDGLEIPTASPDPQDFVPAIDNPYLPLRVGSEWSYERIAGEAVWTLTVDVNQKPRIIAGVATTEVTSVISGPSGLSAGSGDTTSTDYFAQDRAGNVWSFGSDDWLAGVDGARAGLVMPATPRVGDGFLQHDAPGVTADRSSVLDTMASASTPYGSWTAELVEVLDTTGVGAETESRSFYAPDVGLVLAESADGTTELVSYRR